MRVKIKIGDLVIAITAPTKIEVEVEGVEAGTTEKNPEPVKISKKEIPNIPEPEIESVAEESPTPAEPEPVKSQKNEEKKGEAEEVLNEFFKENDKQATILKSSLEEEKKEEEDSKIRQTLEELLGGV